MSTELLRPDADLNRDDLLHQWQTLVNNLASEVRAWSETRGWPVEEKVLTLTEEQFGSYGVPLLVVQLPRPVFLEPVARFVMGAHGRADLYSYPSMDRVMLLYDGERWVIRPELGPAWPLPWSESTFIDLAERLAADP